MPQTESSNDAAVPWRSMGVLSVSLGVPVIAGILHPLLGEIVAVIEIIVTLTIFATALFGSQTLSERAFRLLRWFSNPPNAAGRDQSSLP